MTVKHWKTLLMIFGLASVCLSANAVEVELTQISYDEPTGDVWIKFTGGTYTRESGANKDGFVFDGTTEHGKVLLSLLMTALNNHAEVTLVGAGSFDNFAGSHIIEVLRKAFVTNRLP